MNLWTLILAFVAFTVQDSASEATNNEESWLMKVLDSVGLRSAPSSDLPSWAKDYTESTSGCPCWFDLYMNTTACACCKNEGVQCGYPMHQYCQQRKEGQKQYGCPGVPNSKFTLSTKGHPCLPKGSDTGCAWCVPGAKQCNKMKAPADGLAVRAARGAELQVHTDYIKKTWSGSVCVDIRDYSQCIGVPTSCDVDPNICGSNAYCKKNSFNKTMSEEFNWNVGQCVCKEGFVGNGFQCANLTSGLIIPRSTEKISLNLKYTKDIYNIPIGKKRPGNAEDNFFDKLELIQKNGPSACGDGCKADVAFCGKREPVCDDQSTTPAMASRNVWNS